MAEKEKPKRKKIDAEAPDIAVNEKKKDSKKDNKKKKRSKDEKESNDKDKKKVKRRFSFFGKKSSDEDVKKKESRSPDTAPKGDKRRKQKPPRPIGSADAIQPAKEVKKKKDKKERRKHRVAATPENANPKMIKSPDAPPQLRVKSSGKQSKSGKTPDPRKSAEFHHSGPKVLPKSMPSSSDPPGSQKPQLQRQASSLPKSQKNAMEKARESSARKEEKLRRKPETDLNANEVPALGKPAAKKQKREKRKHRSSSTTPLLTDHSIFPTPSAPEIPVKNEKASDKSFDSQKKKVLAEVPAGPKVLPHALPSEPAKSSQKNPARQVKASSRKEKKPQDESTSKSSKNDERKAKERKRGVIETPRNKKSSEGLQPRKSRPPVVEVQPLSLPSLSQKRERQGAAINIDEVLRIGSVLERYGLDKQRRKAFEWLAEHRSEALKDSPVVAYNLMVAVGDLMLSQTLITKVFQCLLQEGSINASEYQKHFTLLESSTLHLTVAQLSHLLSAYGNQYQSTSEAPTTTKGRMESS